MNLPFTAEQFLEVFARYNLAVWPFQLALYGAALAVIFLAFRKYRASNAAIGFILAFLWIWMGAAYHLGLFVSINPAALIFGTAFILEGAGIGYAAYRGMLSFSVGTDIRSLVGGALVLFALFFYPLIGYTLGHTYPYAPTFGLPCPTTIFTFGVFLWTASTLPRLLLVIPAIWSLIGFSAAFSLGIREDIGLLISGLLAVPLIMINHNMRRTHWKST